MPEDWLTRACSAADAANFADPRRTTLEDGRSVAFEIAYADRLEHWVGRLVPEPSDALRFACRAQHLRRWEIPRTAFPEGRAGYHAWRRNLEDLHVTASRGILGAAGCGPATIARVERIVRKQGRDSDVEVQAMQDAVSLVTVELQMEALESKLAEPKLVDVLRRTLAKMSPAGRALAAGIDVGREARRVLALAMAPGGSEPA